MDAITGTLVILAPKSARISSDSGNAVALAESGSSANVTLVPGADGKLIVRKSAAGEGIDGDGAPWLRRRRLSLTNSRAVKKTRIFVVPTKVDDKKSHVDLALPYILSHGFGELTFANVGAKPLVSVNSSFRPLK